MTNKVKKNKKDKKARNAESVKAPLLSGRQKKIFLVVIVLMFASVPIVDNFRCKASCLKRVKTPYPEIACKYECPWLWERKQRVSRP